MTAPQLVRTFSLAETAGASALSGNAVVSCLEHRAAWLSDAEAYHLLDRMSTWNAGEVQISMASRLRRALSSPPR
jgi:hypothetical protein